MERVMESIQGIKEECSEWVKKTLRQEAAYAIRQGNTREYSSYMQYT